MIKDILFTQQINTDADASLKGIALQKGRAVERLLLALEEDRKAIFCTIEYVDDVLEVDLSGDKAEYTAEQNKSYAKAFSINSHEVKNSLRIFFDNWLGTVQASESIQFVFYTNTTIAKENKVGALSEIDDDLPEEPLIELLIDKKYDVALPFVLLVFKKYYLEQHKKHTKDITAYEKLLDSMSDQQWIDFFNLIDWCFKKDDELDVRKKIVSKVDHLCTDYCVEKRYVEYIVARLMDMVESRAFEDDFLKRVVHVGEVRAIFWEFAQSAKIKEKLDPIHKKWDDIRCDDVRVLKDKILGVCPAYEDDLLEELEEDYIDGVFEQKNYPEIREIKAYNYRVYVVCNRLIRQFLKDTEPEFSGLEINNMFEQLTDEAEKLIVDKAKTYKMPFHDRDMVRKTIILLFQECYLAFDKRGYINE